MKHKFLIAVVVVLVAAASGAAQTKISGTSECKAPTNQNSIDVGDKPGHAFAIGKASCTWSKAMELEGSQTKGGDSISSMEVTGNKVHVNGFHSESMDNGDTFWVHFSGTDTSKDGKTVTSDGTWSFVAGTGKLKGIKGKGTYKGKANADGNVTYEVDGEYSLPPAKAMPAAKAKAPKKKE